MAPQNVPSARPSVPSPDGALIATLQRTRLLIRSATKQHILQTWSLPADFVAHCTTIRWNHLHSSGTSENTGQRILLSDDATIRVFDSADGKWHARINHASGTLGKISRVEFGARNDEVLVFSEFGVKLTIWSLLTNRGVEIRDPKYDVVNGGADFRPGSGHLALLTRSSTQDVLVIFPPGCQEVLKSVDLGTVDAQQVKWSSDGHWIAVREVASAGPRLLLFTADGNYFRTWRGLEDVDDVSQGVKSVAWSPAGVLAVGDYQENVTLLAKDTFSPLMTFPHTVPISHAGARAWEEQISAEKTRSYVEASQPLTPPESSLFTKVIPPRHGISLMTFNHDGTLLATRSDAAPTTAWIWSLRDFKLVSILVHHSPIRSLAWHMHVSDTLLLHCAISDPVVHVWRSAWERPVTVPVALEKTNGRLEAHWIQSRDEESFDVLLTSQVASACASISATGELKVQDEQQVDDLTLGFGNGPEDMFDEGNSLDLSPVKLDGNAVLQDSDSGFGIDDTFHYRRQIKATG